MIPVELPRSVRAATSAADRRHPVPAAGWLLVAFALVAILVGDGNGTIAGGAPLAYDILFVVAAFGLVRLARFRRWTAGASIAAEARRRLPALLGVTAAVAVLWPFVGPFVTRHRVLGDGLTSLVQMANWRYVFGGFAGEAGLSASPFRPMWATSVGAQLALLAIAGLALIARRPLSRRFVLWACGAGAVGSAVWTVVLGRFASITEAGDWPLGIDPTSLPGWLRGAAGMALEPQPIRILFGTDTRASALFVGVAAAVLADGAVVRRLRSRRGQALGLGAALVTAVLVVVTTPLAPGLPSGSFLVTDLLVAAVLLAAVAAGDDAGLLASARRVRAIGATAALAYAVYVWHGPVYALVPDGRLAGPDLLAALVRIAVAIGLGAAWALVVEPSLRRMVTAHPERRPVLAGVAVLVVVAFIVSSVVARPSLTGGTDAEGRPTLVFAGDSMPYILGLETAKDGVDTGAGFRTFLAAVPGCGITGGELQNYGHGQVQDAGCRSWPELWKDQVDAHDPRVSVLLAWGWELYDRKETVDGATRLYEVGTPEWEERLADAVQYGIDVLSARGGKVVILTLPCVDAQIDTATKPNTQATEQWRVAAVNRVVRRVGAANPDTTAVLDLAGYLCPDGSYRARIDQVPMSEDSVHFTWEGARQIWQDWLAPQLRPMVDAPAGS
ncbi:MAG: SGNH hydrolase domain-containing protein [Acidimicrobiales bacterium]